MKARWTRHLGLKVTSIVLSGVMWFAVSGARNLQEGQTAGPPTDAATAVIDQAAPSHAPEQEWALAGIPVRIVGGVQNTRHPLTVTVRVRGTKADVDAAVVEIEAVADAQDSGESGAVPVRVIAPATLRVIAVEPPAVHVTTGDGEGNAVGGRDGATIRN